MLFVVTFTYDPENRDKILKRRAEQGAGFAAGTKVIGEWSNVGGGGGLVIADADDPLKIVQTVRGWSDLVRFTVVPVVETEQLMKLAK